MLCVSEVRRFLASVSCDVLSNFFTNLPKNTGKLNGLLKLQLSFQFVNAQPLHFRIFVLSRLSRLSW